MSTDPITCQGQVQINTAISTGGGGESVSARLPNGPSPGTVWIIDALGAWFSDTVGPADTVSSSLSGFYIVPISAPLPEAVDSPFFINIQARGLALGHGRSPDDGIDLMLGMPAPSLNTFGWMAAPGLPVIIPAGYTVQAVISNSVAGGTGFTGAVTLIMTAQLRILQQR
jgi:hypothetical protein